MTAKLKCAWLMPVTLGISSLISSSSVLADLYQPRLMADIQATNAYQPIQTAQFSTTIGRVNSIEWLVNQLKLADAIDRYDIVTSTLQRLFAINPNNPSGLYYQAKMLLKQHHLQAAEHVFIQLRKVAPNASVTQSLSAVMAIKGRDRKAYQQAQLLSKSGRYNEALRAYNTLFPNGMPTPQLQLEYLLLEGKIRSNYTIVKRGLENLNITYPSVPRFQLALANHIAKEKPDDTWVQNTYRQLVLVPGIGQVAAQAWLKVLNDLPISKSVVQKYAILTSNYPANQEYQKAYQGAMSRWSKEQELLKDPAYRAKLKGLKLLDLNRTRQASKQLHYALSHYSNDPDIVGALGKVYLRLGQQKKALAYFEKTQKLDKNPRNAAKWQSLVQTARYWAYLDDGNSALKIGDVARAIVYYRQAIMVDSRDAYGYNLLANAYLKQKQYTQADKVYQKALRRDRNNHRALLGRLDVRLARNDYVGAIALTECYSASQQRVVSSAIKNIKVKYILQQLHIAQNHHDKAAIKQFLGQLIVVNPSSPWTRYDIANMLVSIGNQAEADRLMAQWSKKSIDPQMHFAYGLYLSKVGQLDHAISELKIVPESQRSLSIKQNLIRLELNKDLINIHERYLHHPNKTTDFLYSLEVRYANQMQPLVRIADAWIEIGKTQDAVRLYKSLSGVTNASLNSLFVYGHLMIKLHLFSDFDLWLKTVLPYIEKKNNNSTVLLEFDELRAQRIVSEAKWHFDHQQWTQAKEWYEKAITLQEPYKLDGQIGLLQSLVMLKEKPEYLPLTHQLEQQVDRMNADQLMTIAMIFNELGLYKQANIFNQLLDNKKLVSASIYRDGMTIALVNHQFPLAKIRAYQALNTVRIEKNPELKEGSKKTPTLRDLYSNSDNYWLTRNIITDIDKLHARNDGHVLFGLDRSTGRNGSSAQSVPIEAKIPIPSLDGHLLLRADTVSLDSGKISYYDKSSTFDVAPFSDKTTGTALGIGWQGENWQVDLGTTPLGFEHSTWVGGVNLDGDWQQWGWSMAISRRPETNNMLSYAAMTIPAGTKDPQGSKWGGIVRTGVKFNTSWDIGGPYGFWSSVQYHQLNGLNVANNTRLGLLGGGYYKLIADDNHRLSIGTNLMYLNYTNNLSEYTLGSGGYFSPQQYFSVSLPVNYYGRYGQTWSYLLSGSVSHSWSYESAPYLSKGSSSTGGGIGYSLQAALEKRISKHWYLGLLTDIQRSEFYTPDHFMFYLKYTFNDRWQSIPFPLAGPKLYSDFY